MRSRLLYTLALLAGCSDQPPATQHGALWPHRDRIASAFEVRSGQLAGSMRKPVRACHRYWASGDPVHATLPPESCEQAAERLAERLGSYLDVTVSNADVRDPALWRYVAARAKL